MNYLKKLHTHSFCIVLALSFQFRLAGNLVFSRFPTSVLNGIKNGCIYQPLFPQKPPKSCSEESED